MLRKKLLCLAALGASSLWASADLPVRIQNTSNGQFADSDIYVAIIGKQGDSSIYYDLTATANQGRCVVNRLDESVNRLHKDGYNDWDYADVFVPLSQIKDHTVYLGDTHACRMFFSFKSPMYLHAFADGGYTGADLNNPGDPNADIRWELVEFTYEPGFEGVGQIWINTTRVDAFQYPMGLELYSAGNRAGSTAYIQRGEYVNYQTVIDRWNANYGNTIFANCYNNPIGKDNLGGIIKQPSKVAALKQSDIFAEYINKVWDYFRYNTANIRMGVLGRWEGRVDGDRFVLTCVEGSYWQPGSQAIIYWKPSTEDAIEGAGAFASGNATDLTVQAMFCAAFNRGQVRTTTDLQDWDPDNGIRPFQGGTEFPCNEYVKFFHDTAISVSDGKTYAFAYDDTFDQSATSYSTAPQSAVVSVGGFNGTVVTPPDPVQPEPANVPAAPAPSVDGSLVKSLFSGSYSSFAPEFMVGGWGQATQASIVPCDGNDAYRMTNFNYLGFQISPSDGRVDVSDMEVLHLDLYAPEAMTLHLYPISFDPTVDDNGVELRLEGGRWNSFDLDLNQFDRVNFANFAQIKLDGGNGQTFYIDNIFFYRHPAVASVPAAPAPSVDGSLVKSLYSGSYSTIAPEFMVGGWGQATQASIVPCEGNDAYRMTDFNYLGFQISPSDGRVDVSDMEVLHLDLYAPEAMTLRMYPISFDPTVDDNGVELRLEGGRWNSFDLDLNQFDRVNFANFAQLKFDGGNGQTFYIDNIFFYRRPVVAPEPAGVPAAPEPTRDAALVKSLYSGRYTSVAPGMFAALWGQSTDAATELCGGNEAFRMANFNYQGFEMGALIDVTDMKAVHVDLYAPEAMDLGFYPISLDPTVDNNKVTIHLDGGRWQSFDFDLAMFPDVDFSRFGQVKFDGGNGQTFYMDNLYFYRDANTVVTPEPGDDETFEMFYFDSNEATEGQLYSDGWLRFVWNGNDVIVTATFNDPADYPDGHVDNGYFYAVTGESYENRMEKTADDTFTVVLHGFKPGDTVRGWTKVEYPTGMAATPMYEFVIPGGNHNVGDVTSGIEAIDAMTEAPAAIYTLSGLRVNPANLAPGLYIKVSGTEVTKILVK
ncbi:MAG: hypothetical protein HDS92_06705 [Bacteroidales bacterium]|nr:hypothetical protein [Bacteroidales bacterium]